MEVGKLETHNSTSGLYLFYFIVDSTTPDNPDSKRLQHYFVSCTVDSYVEAYKYLVRSLCVPATNELFRKWYALYTRVLGEITFENFVKDIQAINTDFFNLDISETAARQRIGNASVGTSSSPLQQQFVGSSKVNTPFSLNVSNHSMAPLWSNESNLLKYPYKNDCDPETALELHRLRSELYQVSAKLRVEMASKCLNNLTEAERAALHYRLEEAHKDIETERIKARDAEEINRTTIKALQDRIEKFESLYEEQISEMTKTEKMRTLKAEDLLMKREAEMKKMLEETVQERDKKIQRAADKIQSMEEYTSKLTGQMIEAKEDNQKLANMLASAHSQIGVQEDVVKKQRSVIELLEGQHSDQMKLIHRLECTQQRKDIEITALMAESTRWRQEAERLAKFAISLQGDLKGLDYTSSTAAELLRSELFHHGSKKI
eukprot:Tbor_TRINITY_DN4391_c0_g1::TRINITY_DN4391_c0_g1_i1::g.7865::m.7865